MKGIAFCAMLIHHLFLNYRDISFCSFKIALICKACVAIFVFLSGYGLAIQYGKTLRTDCGNGLIMQTLKFMINRYKKFYLNYWFIFILFVPLGVFVFGRSLQTAYGDSNLVAAILLDFLGLKGIASYNVTWWFNQLILCLYLFFPLLYLASRTVFSGLAFLVLFYVWPREIFGVLEYVCSPLSSYLVVFFLGIYMAQHADRWNSLLSKIRPVFVTLISFVLLVFLCYCRNNAVIKNFWGVAIDPFICLLLALLMTSINNVLSKENKGKRMLCFLGTHSMNMYLTHTFVISYFFSIFVYGIKNPLAIFLVSLISTLLISIVIEFVKGKIGFCNFFTKKVQSE